jgi:hypothetical protein
MPSIVELTRASSLIFTGTVVEIGASTVPILRARNDFAVVRVDRGLRVDPALGDLRGRVVTVAPVRGDALRVEQQAVFFTRSWIHGGGIAVREIAHETMNAEREVVAAVHQLPDMHLQDRLKSADLVVLGEVIATRPVERITPERDRPLWWVAELRVDSVLKGSAKLDGGTVEVHYPTSDARPWYRAPRFEKGQRAAVLLHRDAPKAAASLRTIDRSGTLTALDPADVQPESRFAELRQLLGARDTGGEIR